MLKGWAGKILLCHYFMWLTVPPTRSGIPDFGPDPDFFGQTGPKFCQKSGFKKKLPK